MGTIQRVASGFWPVHTSGISQEYNPDLGRLIYRATQEIKNLMHNGALEPCPDTTRTPG
jgi:hypothetical protein